MSFIQDIFIYKNVFFNIYFIKYKNKIYFIFILKYKK